MRLRFTAPALGLLACLSFVALTVAPKNAHAFCGFYVAPPGDKPLYADASMVSLMREGTRTVLSMSNNYKGPAKDFAMVVPVPVVLKKEDVKTLPMDVFKKLDTLTSPRLVEYWETDPCDHPCANAEPGTCGYGTGSGSGYGYGSGGGGGGSVTIEAKFSVGEYDIVVLGATESAGLETWLHDNKYSIPSGAAKALQPYIDQQQKFFVAKVDIKKVKLDANGVAVLSPLRIAYESADFRLPVRLGLINAQAKQDLIVFVLSKDKRYDLANYPNVFIPTNLEVTEATAKSFAPFYAALFDAAVAQGNGHGIVTEYSWESSSCDPCPTPPLGTEELSSLGGDVLFPNTPKTPLIINGVPQKPVSTGMSSFNRSMVITRLHARYDSTSLGEDLIFRASAPITGGRESDYVGEGYDKLGTAAYPAGYNNFQARYIMRHTWTGPIACKNPERGKWGDKPAWMTSKPKPASAVGLAAAPRGKIQLATYLKSGMPAIEVAAVGVPTGLGPDAGPSDAGSPTLSTLTEPDAGDASAEGDAGSGDASFGGTPPPAIDKGPRGCSCEIVGETSDVSLPAGASFLALGVALFERRRRNARRKST